MIRPLTRGNGKFALLDVPSGRANLWHAAEECAMAKKKATAKTKLYGWVLSCDVRTKTGPIEKTIAVEFGTPLPRVGEVMQIDLGSPTNGDMEFVVKKISHRVFGDTLIPHIEMRLRKHR